MPPARRPSPASSSSSSTPSPSASLAALLRLLDAFNHRHRNQHRASHWWAPFSILRRALRALVAALPPPPSSSSSASSCSSSSPSPASVSAEARARARRLTAHLVPAAFLAFTQLAADNQHAPLGLMLLAVLGHAHAVLARLPVAESTTATATATTTTTTKEAATTSTTTTTTTTTAPAPTTTPPAVPDRGVVISRREPPLPAGGEPPASPTRLPASKTHARESPAPGGGAKSKRKRTNKGQDALSSLFSSLH